MIEKHKLWSAGIVAALALLGPLAAAGTPAAAQTGDDPEEIGPAVGSPAPDFQLAAVTDGAEHTLSETLEERPVVMVFFRGAW